MPPIDNGEVLKSQSTVSIVVGYKAYIPIAFFFFWWGFTGTYASISPFRFN